MLEMKFPDNPDQDFKLNENWEKNNDFFYDTKKQILEYFD
jgi:hypothetical protein